jgi:hypothetical protein
MKRIFLSIALLVVVISSLSSCVATQQRRGSRYHRGYDRHHGPYDSNYRNYDRYHRY